jgi:hypothetical protein
MSDKLLNDIESKNKQEAMNNSLLKTNNSITTKKKLKSYEL